MRVIAGSAGGRRLLTPKGRDTRPTSDRVREALFSALAPHLPGASVLDLYAGSGALGIEALSRGAAAAVFVERDARTAQVIRRNLATLDLEGGQVRAIDADRYCRAPSDGPFDLVLADPPYDVAVTAITAQLGALLDAGALAPGAVVVVERRRGGDAPDPIPGMAWTRERAYGDTVLYWAGVDEERA